jgi:hypothetical protein
MSTPDSWWTSGYCSIFAAAMQKRYGGEIWAISNELPNDPNDAFLWHCYCVIDEIAYDAHGGHSIHIASDTKIYTMPPEDIKHGAVFVWKKVDVKWLDQHHDDYDPELFPDVYTYIERNQKMFPVKSKMATRTSSKRHRSRTR